MKWTGLFALKWEMKNGHRNVVGKREGKRPFGRPSCKWEDLKEWIHPAQDRHRWRAVVNMVMS